MDKMKTERTTLGRTKRSNRIRRTRGEKAFTVFNYTVLTLLGMSTLFPFLNVLAKSLSSETAVISGQVKLWPVGLQFGTFKYVFANSQFISSFKVSVFITVVGTFLSMLVTVFTAYPLSKPHLRGRRVFLLLFIFVMLFSGGMIPNYLLMQRLNLLNNIWVLILPNLVNVFNLLIIKNFFEGVPESLEEAARIDGASNFTVLFRIVLPISKPVLATISLFYAVYYWNDFFHAMIYISNPQLKPLQLYLYELITQWQKPIESIAVDQAMNLSPQSIQAATIMASTVPILLVYPFLQKYFVQGITVGSVKG